MIFGYAFHRSGDLLNRIKCHESPDYSSWKLVLVLFSTAFFFWNASHTFDCLSQCLMVAIMWRSVVVYVVARAGPQIQTASPSSPAQLNSEIVYNWTTVRDVERKAGDGVENGWENLGRWFGKDHELWYILPRLYGQLITQQIKTLRYQISSARIDMNYSNPKLDR